MLQIHEYNTKSGGTRQYRSQLSKLVRNYLIPGSKGQLTTSSTNAADNSGRNSKNSSNSSSSSNGSSTSAGAVARRIPIAVASTAVSAHKVSRSGGTGSNNNAARVRGELVDLIVEHLGSDSSENRSSSRFVSNDNNYMAMLDAVDVCIFTDLSTHHWPSFMSSSPDYHRFFQFMSMSQRKLSEEANFFMLRVVGRGGFGQVHACKSSTTGKLYALKIMNKQRVKMKKAAGLVINERNIMVQVNSPFVVTLKYAFQNETELFLVLDLMLGGDLGYALSRKGRFSLIEAKYYAARTLLGLAALHSSNIVYRDLKPDNILCDVDGYTRLSDFGLAAIMTPEGLTGTCGTRGYWAPEMLKRNANGNRERYSFAVDWFSFGVVVCECLTGVSPFRTEQAKTFGSGGLDLKKVEKMDRTEKDKFLDRALLEMEPDLSVLDTRDEEETTGAGGRGGDSNRGGESRSLVAALLNKDPTQRLGAGGHEEVMSHPWFRSVNWDALVTAPPPLRPGKDSINAAAQSEIGFFADAKEVKKVKLESCDQEVYADWDYFSLEAFQEEVVEFLAYEEIMGPIKPRSGEHKCCSIC